MNGHILRPKSNRRTGQQQLHLRQVGMRHANTGTATYGSQPRLDLVEQRLVGRQATIHLPVADDQLVTHPGFPQVITILPTC